MGDSPSTAARRLDDVESQVRMLKTEWLDTLDKLERLVGRVAKRAERDQAAGLLSGEGAASTGGNRPAGSPALVAVMKRRSGGLEE